MRVAIPLLRVGLFVLFIAVIGRPITGCTKNPLNLRQNDSTDTVFHPKQYDSAVFYVSFDMYVYNTSGVYNDTFADNASLRVYVVNGVVSLDSILNFPPVVYPESGSNALYKAVWIPDNIGTINIVSGLGIVGTDDTSVSVILQHSGTVSPKWQITALSDGTTSTFGGESTPGWPAAFTFSTKQQAQDAFKLEQPGSYWDVWVYKDY
jgi:hypothetical protein